MPPRQRPTAIIGPPTHTRPAGPPYQLCPKALIRSELWNPERHIERSQLPPQGEILRLLSNPAFDAEDYERDRAQRYARREGFY